MPHNTYLTCTYVQWRCTHIVQMQSNHYTYVGYKNPIMASIFKVHFNKTIKVLVFLYRWLSWFMLWLSMLLHIYGFTSMSWEASISWRQKMLLMLLSHAYSFQTWPITLTKHMFSYSFFIYETCFMSLCNAIHAKY